MGRALAECDGVIGVSKYVRDELARSGRVAKRKLAAIPNLVHLSSVDDALGGEWPLPDINPDAPFLLFAGKLDYNKGAQMLPETVARLGVTLPVVIAGEGRMQAKIEADAKRSGLDFRFYGWLDNDATVLLMGRAKALLFPSAWQEPLSRVLLEGCAAGAAIVALDTGGTRDIVTHMESGWLASDMDSFVEGVQKVSQDSDLNMRLRAGARARAEERFSSERVSARMEALYRKLLEAKRG
jgi:glycosyltransferase involved in cell wall biosynthesis